MQITKHTYIGQLVAIDYKFASIFQNHKIDFFCNGNRSIEEVTTEQNIDINKLITQLKNLSSKKNHTKKDFQNWPLDILADYIEKNHHRFTENKISELKPLLHELVEQYNSSYPELIEILEAFHLCAGEMASHMKKEEIILFPFIRKMVKTKKSSSNITTPHFGTVENPVRMMLHEHDVQSKLLQKLSDLSNNYTPPSGVSKTYSDVYKTMQIFEKDMQKHIHLENNILFPKAIVLEKTLDKE